MATRKQVAKQCPDCSVWVPNGGALDSHRRSDNCWGDSVPILTEATKAIWCYWKRKKNRTEKEAGKNFKLSPTEMVQLLEDAAIAPNDIGTRSHQYVLARHNDTGDYEINNCRFITHRENIQERDHSNVAEAMKKKTHTPHGTFNSLNEAAKHYKRPRTTIANRIHSTTERMKEYYYE